LEMLVDGDGLLQFSYPHRLSMGQIGGFYGESVILIGGDIFRMGSSVVRLLTGSDSSAEFDF